MTIVNVIIVLVFSWWIIFFMALPIGVRVPETIEKGHASSAPSEPRIITKAIITTVLSLTITLSYFYALEKGYLDFVDKLYQ